MKLGAEEKIRVGQPAADETETVVGSFPPAAKGLGAVFEDDGTTGYLYAVERGDELELLDALHVYDVADVADPEQPVTVQLFWNEPETAVVLLLNGASHALFDFQRRMGFCRTAYPPAQHEQPGSRELTDELVEKYFAA